MRWTGCEGEPLSQCVLYSTFQPTVLSWKSIRAAFPDNGERGRQWQDGDYPISIQVLNSDIFRCLLFRIPQQGSVKPHQYRS
jgi:hypothetical protein